MVRSLGERRTFIVRTGLTFLRTSGSRRSGGSDSLIMKAVQMTYGGERACGAARAPRLVRCRCRGVVRRRTVKAFRTLDVRKASV